MSNPLGERAPSEPVPGGCGALLCAHRAWLALDCPSDPPEAPCDRCTAAVLALMTASQDLALRPSPADKRRGRRGQSPAGRRADLARSLRSADCHTVGPL